MMKSYQERRRKNFAAFLALFILFSLVGFDLPQASAGPVDGACHQFSDGKCASHPEGEEANDLVVGMSNLQVSPASTYGFREINLSRTRVLDGQPINTIVGTLSTVDSLLFATHTYSLVHGPGSTDNGSFNISGDQLRTSAEFNADIKNTYDILVRSTNQHDMFVEKHFRITVTKAGDERFIYLPLIINDGGINSQFDDHKDGWVVHSGEWFVLEGNLVTLGIEEESSSISYDKSFRNFDYQVRMGRTGIISNANRIFVRGTPTPLQRGNRWYSGYSFQYNRRGYYSIFKYFPNGSFTAMQDWTPSSAINQGDQWNVLRVVAIGNQLAFYINGTLVWQGIDNAYSSGRVGIGMYLGGEPGYGDGLYVDWAVLTPLGTSGAQGLNVPDPMLLNHHSIIEEMIIEGDQDQDFIPQ